MLRSVNALVDFTIRATDGDIGHVETLYFDDRTWTIRYFVVDTSNWLAGRRVLISPMSLRRVDWDEEAVHVALTRAQVEGSPGVDTQLPVSRQHELEYYAYFEYPYYWAGPYRWGSSSRPSGVMAGTPQGATEDEPRRPGVVPGTLAGAESEEEPWWDQSTEGDPHLRSTEEVTGYHIQARDGEVGDVEDFLVDDDAWAVRYVVVDTGRWLPGKKVLVSPEWIQSVDWRESKVHVDLSRDTIKKAPEYDASTPVGRDYEARLYDHYGRRRYWGEQRRAA
jgi:uncharacterized protein YrrD